MVDDLRELKGVILKPAELISYQEGSVVSRMIVYTPQGTITLFAFASGSGLSEHSAPYDAVVQILEGSAEITIQGISQTTKCGEMIILPADIPHAVYAQEAFKMVLTMIHA